MQYRLAHALAARDELLAIVVHDLRNPLHAIGLAVDMLADPALDPELRARYIAAVRRSLGRASRIICDLLDINELDGGRLELDRRPITVGEVLDDTLRDHATALHEAGMAARLSLDPAIGHLVVDVDPRRTGQALGNLMSNAIQYARGTDTVDLSARATADTVELIVADRGPGLPVADLPHVFERFHAPPTTTRGRTGLGLAIAHGIARAHGGDLTAHFRVGGGAELRYRLAVVH